MTSSTPLRLRPALLLGVVLACVYPGAAAAAVFPGEPIDGPSADIVSVGDLDVSRDGTGAVTYVKQEAGVDHVWAARLVDGAFAAPERVDASGVPCSSAALSAAAGPGADRSFDAVTEAEAVGVVGVRRSAARTADSARSILMASGPCTFKSISTCAGAVTCVP